MAAQFNDGKVLLGRFTELMGTGNRCAALLYRDSLSPQQLEAFYRAMKSPWIVGGLPDSNTSRLSLSFIVDEVTSAVEFIRDIRMIAMAHGCSTDIELDESRRIVKLILSGTTDPVRKVVMSWVRGYVTFDGDERQGRNFVAATFDVAQNSLRSTDFTLSQ